MSEQISFVDLHNKVKKLLSAGDSEINIIGKLLKEHPQIPLLMLRAIVYEYSKWYNKADKPLYLPSETQIDPDNLEFAQIVGSNWVMKFPELEWYQNNTSIWDYFDDGGYYLGPDSESIGLVYRNPDGKSVRLGKGIRYVLKQTM